MRWTGGSTAVPELDWRTGRRADPSTDSFPSWVVDSENIDAGPMLGKADVQLAGGCPVRAGQTHRPQSLDDILKTDGGIAR